MEGTAGERCESCARRCRHGFVARVAAFALAGSRLTACLAALGLLNDGQHLISTVKGNFDRIRALNNDSSDAIPDYALVKQVNVTRNNVQQTLADAEAMLQIPSKVAAIREALDDENYILQVRAQPRAFVLLLSALWRLIARTCTNDRLQQLHSAIRELESQRDQVLTQIGDQVLFGCMQTKV